MAAAVGLLRHAGMTPRMLHFYYRHTEEHVAPRLEQNHVLRARDLRIALFGREPYEFNGEGHNPVPFANRLFLPVYRTRNGLEFFPAVSPVMPRDAEFTPPREQWWFFRVAPELSRVRFDTSVSTPGSSPVVPFVNEELELLPTDHTLALMTGSPYGRPAATQHSSAAALAKEYAQRVRVAELAQVTRQATGMLRFERDVLTFRAEPFYDADVEFSRAQSEAVRLLAQAESGPPA